MNVRMTLTDKSLPHRNCHNAVWCACLFLLVILSVTAVARAQRSNAIWGEIKIDETEATVVSGVTVILDKAGAGEVGRQSVSNRGRYRFTDLDIGEYEVIIEVDGREITRARIQILQGTLAPHYGYRQDFEFKWRSTGPPRPKAEVISAADSYSRSSANEALFRRAQDAAGKKKYDEASHFLKTILDNDKADFQVWTLQGTLHLIQEQPEDAEKAYLAALEVKPTYSQALMHLARLRTSQKRHEESLDPLNRLLQLQPESAEINLMLGEAYLQVKKGSKAVPYMNEAARLGKSEAHLRLAWLYNAAGMKDKAASEYEEFLKKKPDYAERKKLEEYVQANKKN